MYPVFVEELILHSSPLESFISYHLPHVVYYPTQIIFPIPLLPPRLRTQKPTQLQRLLYPYLIVYLSLRISPVLESLQLHHQDFRKSEKLQCPSTVRRLLALRTIIIFDYTLLLPMPLQQLCHCLSPVYRQWQPPYVVKCYRFCIALFTLNSGKGLSLKKVADDGIIPLKVVVPPFVTLRKKKITI